jgi:hypothetical protein
MSFESVVNTAVKIPFVSTNNTTGLTSFSNVFVLKNGVSAPQTITYAEIGAGLYVATFTPASTGQYTVFIEGRVQAEVAVVSKTLYTMLQTIEDEAIGSWVWNKTTNTLTLYRQDASTLAGFSVVDNLTTASRQRTSP